MAETILPLARLGSGITLDDGRTSALLGEFPVGLESSKGGDGSQVDGPEGQEGGMGGERCSSSARYLVLDRMGCVEAVLLFTCEMRW